MIDHLFTHTASRIRSIEEMEISRLASHCEGPNDIGWCDVFCHGCEANVCVKGSARELGEKAWGLGWMVYLGNPLCPICQQK